MFAVVTRTLVSLRKHRDMRRENNGTRLVCECVLLESGARRIRHLMLTEQYYLLGEEEKPPPLVILRSLGVIPTAVGASPTLMRSVHEARSADFRLQRYKERQMEERRASDRKA